MGQTGYPGAHGARKGARSAKFPPRASNVGGADVRVGGEGAGRVVAGGKETGRRSGGGVQCGTGSSKL